MKKILFIFQHSPYQSHITKDGFDALFAAASFEQPLSVVFLHEGVWSLAKQQQASEIARKSFEKLISAFELYDIHDIYVDAESLVTRSLTPENLSIETMTLVSSHDMETLIASHQHILSF